MISDDIELPKKSAALIDAEEWFNRIRAQARETGDQLKAIRTAISRNVMAEMDGGGVDSAAARMASGEIEDFRQEDLPLAQRDLERRLEVLRRSAALLHPELERLRRRHANQTAAAIRPLQREAVEKIDAALSALLEANSLELACHAIRPGTPLVACGFPGITAERAKFWRDHCERNGLLGAPSPPLKAAPRKLFGGRGKASGGAAEPLAVAANAAD